VEEVLEMGMLNHLKFPVREAAERNGIASKADGDPVKRTGMASAVQKAGSEEQHRENGEGRQEKANNCSLTKSDSNSPGKQAGLGCQEEASYPRS
jgi:hypothetical protein